jgi:hypothetical protein
VSEFYMRYVGHARVSAYVALGWVVCGAMRSHHGIYSTLMKWPHADAPVEPPAEQDAPRVEQGSVACGVDGGNHGAIGRGGGEV